MNRVIELITNNNYKVLKLLNDNQVQVEGVYFTAITQAEIANKLSLSKVTINSIIKNLQEQGLVCPFENHKGRYCLTNNAKDMVIGIEKLKNKKGE